MQTGSLGSIVRYLEENRPLFAKPYVVFEYVSHKESPTGIAIRGQFFTRQESYELTSKHPLMVMVDVRRYECEVIEQ